MSTVAHHHHAKEEGHIIVKLKNITGQAEEDLLLDIGVRVMENALSFGTHGHLHSYDLDEDLDGQKFLIFPDTADTQADEQALVEKVRQRANAEVAERVSEPGFEAKEVQATTGKVDERDHHASERLGDLTYDDYIRGYFKISGLDDATLTNIADDIMHNASDFIWAPDAQPEGLMADRHDKHLLSGDMYNCGIITRANIVSQPITDDQGNPTFDALGNPREVHFIIAPFVAYYNDVLDDMEELLRGVTRNAIVACYTVIEYHGSPNELPAHQNLGREEIHRPGNYHGNGFC
jgi:hypothetical protein